jgi:hypothetical protein
MPGSDIKLGLTVTSVSVGDPEYTIGSLGHGDFGLSVQFHEQRMTHAVSFFFPKVLIIGFCSNDVQVVMVSLNLEGAYCRCAGNNKCRDDQES